MLTQLYKLLTVFTRYRRSTLFVKMALRRQITTPNYKQRYYFTASFILSLHQHLRHYCVCKSAHKKL